MTEPCPMYSDLDASRAYQRVAGVVACIPDQDVLLAAAHVLKREAERPANRDLLGQVSGNLVRTMSSEAGVVLDEDGERSESGAVLSPYRDAEVCLRFTAAFLI